MILEKFFTTEFDTWKVFVRPDVTFGEFKNYVYAQKTEFEKSDIKNVVLLCENYFDFAVNFFGAIFADKNIYLLSDKTRLQMLEFDYILPQKVSPVSGKFLGEFNPCDIMINLFTSGSTGVPKNIGKTLLNLEKEADATIKDFNLQEGWTICSTTSSAHSYGLAFNFILAFYGNFRINQEKIEFPEQFCDCNILVSTPSFMEKLAKYEFEFKNPPEKIFLAGAKLKNEVFEYFSKYSDVIDIYGSTETGNIAYKRGGDVFNVISGVGVDSSKEDKILIKTPFCPYEAIVLSDIIEKVSKNKFILKKRTDRIVKIQEKRISLDELEMNLKKHSSVIDCYCFIYNNNLCCAVASFDINLDGKILKQHLAQFSEIVPKRWRILDEIPKTQNGKIDILRLKKIFGLKLSLPFIISREFNQELCEIKMIFKKNSNFFEGHFSEFPILPGVVQLYFARYFAEDICDKLSPDIKKIKFSNIIKPDTEIILQLQNKENCVEFVYKNDEKIFSSGTFVKENLH